MIKLLPIESVLLLEPIRFGHKRGIFAEIFRASELAEVGLDRPFVQDNFACSAPRGVVRGPHMHGGAEAQDKLFRVSHGWILDEVVDPRPGSPTFGKSVSAALSAQDWLQFLIPAGFADGYCTPEEDCEALSKVTAPYAPASEEGLLWSDLALGMEWPVDEKTALINDRDAFGRRCRRVPS